MHDVLQKKEDSAKSSKSTKGYKYMACYHPLRGAYTNNKKATGKNQVKVFPAATTGNKYVYQNIAKPEVFDCSDHVFDSRYWRRLETFMIPCGQCIGCRLDYSRRWATRLMLELQCHQTAYFITLTYDDDHIIRGNKLAYTLVPEDVTNFMKRLRKEQSTRTDTKIRFFLAGEYGSETHRPHYHLIVYDWIPPENDLVFLKNSFSGNKYLYSLTLNKLWTHGFNVVADVCWKSCAYVARYILKKHKGTDSNVYEDLGIEPEFSRMSRRPGIGKEYYDAYAKDMLSQGYVQMPDGLCAPIPRYFDPFFEIDYPKEYEKLSDDRVETAKMLQVIKEYATELDYFEQLAIDEQAKEFCGKMLIRPNI